MYDEHKQVCKVVSRSKIDSNNQNKQTIAFCDYLTMNIHLIFFVRDKLNTKKRKKYESYSFIED